MSGFCRGSLTAVVRAASGNRLCAGRPCLLFRGRGISRRPIPILLGRLPSASLRMHPLVTYVSLPPTHTIRPKPVMRRPGSIPRMRRTFMASPGAAWVPSRRRFLDDGGGVHVLHVVDRLECIEELLHSGGGLARQRDFGGRLHGQLGEFGFEP